MLLWLLLLLSWWWIGECVVWGDLFWSKGTVTVCVVVDVVSTLECRWWCRLAKRLLHKITQICCDVIDVFVCSAPKIICESCVNVCVCESLPMALIQYTMMLFFVFISFLGFCFCCFDCDVTDWRDGAHSSITFLGLWHTFTHTHTPKTIDQRLYFECVRNFMIQQQQRRKTLQTPCERGKKIVCFPIGMWTIECVCVHFVLVFLRLPIYTRERPQKEFTVYTHTWHTHTCSHAFIFITT